MRSTVYALPLHYPACMAYGIFWLLIFATVTRAAGTLTVAAAADLSPAQAQLQRGFARLHPAEKLSFVIGASAVLAQQIEQDAPYDVFLSADQSWVDDLMKHGKIVPASVRVYATGQIALLCRSGKCADPGDLLRRDIHFVALANPKLAPYGAAAIAALRKSGVWKQISPKVVYGENVRQALQLFDSGNADAVITAASLVVGRGATILAAGSHPGIRQSAGVIARSAHPQEGSAFIDFLTSAEGWKILNGLGFGRP